MTPLRTTAPNTIRQLRGARVCGIWIVALGVLGCGRGSLPTEEPAPAATPAEPSKLQPQQAQETLPPPDVVQLKYNAGERVLNLYDLPNSDRWMVRLPNEARGQPVGPQHRLPEGVDTSRTMVYYTRPGVRVSVAVSVAEIEACQVVDPSRLAAAP